MVDVLGLHAEVSRALVKRVRLSANNVTSHGDLFQSALGRPTLNSFHQLPAYTFTTAIGGYD
ncbi:MAG: hypothetical protein QOE34_1786 [Verrucomicrobiota bacterium]